MNIVTKRLANNYFIFQIIIMKPLKDLYLMKRDGTESENVKLVVMCIFVF